MMYTWCLVLVNRQAAVLWTNWSLLMLDCSDIGIVSCNSLSWRPWRRGSLWTFRFLTCYWVQYNIWGQFSPGISGIVLFTSALSVELRVPICTFLNMKPVCSAWVVPTKQILKIDAWHHRKTFLYFETKFLVSHNTSLLQYQDKMSYISLSFRDSFTNLVMLNSF